MSGGKGGGVNSKSHSYLFVESLDAAIDFSGRLACKDIRDG